MPYIDREIEKVYYSIAEVAKILDCATSKVRFYEKAFAWTAPKKNKAGHRHYNRSQVKELVNIVYLIDKCGISIAGIVMAKQNGYLEDLLNFFMDINFNFGVHQAKRL